MEPRLGWPSSLKTGGKMSKVRMFVVAALLALLVAAAMMGAKASWKWSGQVKKTDVQYKIAGWSWGSGKARGAETQL